MLPCSVLDEKTPKTALKMVFGVFRCRFRNIKFLKPRRKKSRRAKTILSLYRATGDVGSSCFNAHCHNIPTFTME